MFCLLYRFLAKTIKQNYGLLIIAMQYTPPIIGRKKKLTSTTCRSIKFYIVSLWDIGNVTLSSIKCHWRGLCCPQLSLAIVKKWCQCNKGYTRPCLHETIIAHVITFKVLASLHTQEPEVTQSKPILPKEKVLMTAILL